MDGSTESLSVRDVLVSTRLSQMEMGTVGLLCLHSVNSLPHAPLGVVRCTRLSRYRSVQEALSKSILVSASLDRSD